MSSSQDNKNNFQYASSTPSVSSILNLPTVQEKKKAVGKVVGLSMGLAVNKPQTLKATFKPIIKFKENSTTTTTVTSEENKNILNTKAPVDISNSSETLKQIDLKIRIKASESKSQSQTHLNTKNKIKTKNIETVTNENSIKIQKSKARNFSASNSENKNKLEINHFDPAHWRLFVGNLGPEVTESLLLTTFQNPYPSTSQVLIVKDWKTQKSKGYGFVAFSEGKEFLRALKEMQGKWIGNRQCIIKKSEHQPTTIVK